MSFTIKCDECGAEHKFVEGEPDHNYLIHVWATREQEAYISCQNTECKNSLEVE